MKKLFVQGLLLFIIIVLGWAVIHEYFSYVGPQLARQQAVTADLKQLEVDKEKLLLLNRAVEERLRIEKNDRWLFSYMDIILTVNTSKCLLFYVASTK
jgi:hypothetical protein